MDSDNKKRTSEKPISLAPLTPDEALAAALSVNKAEVDRLEAQESSGKAKQPKKKK